ncbi:uncharacterized protein LOC134195817 [Corticium candelabrum]|uniref:uncharacterized protein LOC134195817 n=1 Tax=Corticium candelabrum TaxID=121492 RepID=UPI002E27073C|nr:uncharacterized protein LOC134195817 [Corticium candelabrum]
MYPAGKYESGKRNKHISHIDILERTWRAEQVNSREKLLLERRLEMISKQQKIAVKSIEKEKAMLERALASSHLRRWKSTENCLTNPNCLANPDTSPSSENAGASSCQTHTHALTTRRLSEPVERHVRHLLPPLDSKLRLSKSATHLHQMHADLTHSRLQVPGESNTNVEINELSLRPEFRRHLSPSPSSTSRRRLMKCDQSVGGRDVKLLSPLPDHHAFKAGGKTNAALETFQENGLLPRITVAEPNN